MDVRSIPMLHIILVEESARYAVERIWLWEDFCNLKYYISLFCPYISVSLKSTEKYKNKTACGSWNKSLGLDLGICLWGINLVCSCWDSF